MARVIPGPVGEGKARGTVHHSMQTRSTWSFRASRRRALRLGIAPALRERSRILLAVARRRAPAEFGAPFREERQRGRSEDRTLREAPHLRDPPLSPELRRLAIRPLRSRGTYKQTHIGLNVKDYFLENHKTSSGDAFTPIWNRRTAAGGEGDVRQPGQRYSWPLFTRACVNATILSKGGEHESYSRSISARESNISASPE